MSIATISYSLAAFIYLVFFLVLLTDKHRGANKKLLHAATFISIAWAVSAAVEANGLRTSALTDYIAVFKSAAWIVFISNMLVVLRSRDAEDHRSGIDVFRHVTLILGATILVILLLINIDIGLDIEDRVLFYSLHLLLAVAGIVVIEQLYRNVSAEQRWVIKYLCIGLLGTFVFDFYMYSDALLYQRVDPVLWEARGFIFVMVVPLVAYSVLKDPLWSPEIFISRRVVFHTTTLLASAIYLFIMGVAGYYVREYGGNWGAVVQALLLFTTVLVLFLFLGSRRIRAKVKVFLNKHFYPYKYDYREEWLRLIRTISSSTARLYHESIRAIAQIIESPAGLLWINTGHGYYECVAGLEAEEISVKQPTRSSLPRFLQENEFVINVDEYKENPEMYSRLGELELPDWVEQANAWLIVPLIHIDSLIGFIVLEHAPERRKHFNWEDSDLLKTAARQVASYISQQKISVALAEAKQFEQFNKISTYVVHDIKNLMTQLSLIVANAEKHKNNPLFMQDAIKTIDNTVSKMNKMIDVVKRKPEDTANHRFNLIDLLGELVDFKEIVSGKPVPTLECASNEAWVRADRDQLLSIFGHIVQNAQDATDDDGSIHIIQEMHGGDIIVRIEDTGCGMSEGFIKDHLFRPFKSTKRKGMGIGVYETREILSALGGMIDVQSQVDVGTTFTITLPVAKE